MEILKCDCFIWKYTEPGALENCACKPFSCYLSVIHSMKKKEKTMSQSISCTSALLGTPGRYGGNNNFQAALCLPDLSLKQL